MKTAKIFQTRQGQAISLPKEFRFNGNEVYIKKIGKITVLLPVDNPWAKFLDSLNNFSKDFMEARKQPAQEKREDLFE